MSEPETRSFDRLITTDEVDEPTGSKLDDFWAHLLRTPLRLRLWYWGGPLAVTLIATVLRLWNLANPHSLVFDETFYVKDSWTILHNGFETTWPEGTDPSFNSGNVGSFTSDPEFVAHPPLGKWIISLGMMIFGAQNSFGWRVSTAIVGVIAVVVVMLLARKLFKSTMVAVIIGFLMAIEGNAIVMSRVALLDNSVMFIALLGFVCIVYDHEWHARRLAMRVAQTEASGRPSSWGPALWWRPWLIGAGVLFGLDAGVKWSGFYFLAVFGAYVIVTDVLARRRAGVPFWLTGGVLKQGPISFILVVPVALLSYVVTWSGWLFSSGGYYRDYASNPDFQWGGALSWVPQWAQSLWHYQSQMYAYSINLHTPHPYQSNPLTWLFMIRPTSMYYQGDKFGQHGCVHSACSSAIVDLANPLIWWAATAACLYLVYRVIRYREWRLGLILTGLIAGYLPWMLYINRTIFTFYSIAFEPYMMLALACVIALILGKRTDPTWRRVRGIGIVAAFVIVSSLVTAFFYPLWTGQQIPFEYWNLHMWLNSWR